MGTAANLTSKGTLTVAATPAWAANAPLTGKGALTATTVLNVSATAGLTGSGQLTAATAPALVSAAALTGTGGLTVQTLAGYSTDTDLTGSGTLTAVATVVSGFRRDVHVDLNPHTRATLTPSVKGITLDPARRNTEINPHVF
jgi:hypothetical protein